MKEKIKNMKIFNLSTPILVLFSLIIIALIILSILVYKFIFPSVKQTDLYGKRVENIYQITDEDYKSLEDYFSTAEFVNSIKFVNRGAMIYITINVSDVTVDDLKKSFEDSIYVDGINSEFLNSYDLNITFINPTEVVDEEGTEENGTEENGTEEDGECKIKFPVTAYRNKKTELISWQNQCMWEYEDEADENQDTEDNQETNE